MAGSAPTSASRMTQPDGCNGCVNRWGGYGTCHRAHRGRMRQVQVRRTRKQFGVTLNKFQTLTQRAVEMYVSLELARNMNLYADMSIADRKLDPVIASRAKLRIGRAARHIGQEAIQLHGGIGVTAEYPVGHYVARLSSIEQSLGSSDDHLHVLINQIGDFDVVSLSNLV
jgi:alkylation response protein AidB-like acyl-CoA dehydrogenase